MCISFFLRLRLGGTASKKGRGMSTVRRSLTARCGATVAVNSPFASLIHLFRGRNLILKTSFIFTFLSFTFLVFAM